MDQMPVYFLMNSKNTLAVKGNKTINIHTSTSNTKRCTVAVMICADWMLLPSVVVFKGTANGHIAKTGFATYPPNQQYHCQAAAWMDKTVMLVWVNGPLKAHVELAPAVPIRSMYSIIG